MIWTAGKALPVLPLYQDRSRRDWGHLLENDGWYLDLARRTTAILRGTPSGGFGPCPTTSPTRAGCLPAVEA